ncbi:MAG TPA: pyrroloquinoline quinone biosynthesis protein C, partial [Gammaproteobacteria bacterium]|nr:pyrroloquinoline quinone biosynthesis protein C [Gammaproteobacteria bacterium]
MNNSAQNSTVWTSEEFERQLRSLGNRYHIHHPFQVMMNRGELTREQIQGWVCNRFYYQISIPLKDGALISNCPDREVRR